MVLKASRVCCTSHNIYDMPLTHAARQNKCTMQHTNYSVEPQLYVPGFHNNPGFNYDRLVESRWSSRRNNALKPLVISRDYVLDPSYPTTHTLSNDQRTKWKCMPQDCSAALQPAEWVLSGMLSSPSHLSFLSPPAATCSSAQSLSPLPRWHLLLCSSGRCSVQVLICLAHQWIANKVMQTGLGFHVCFSWPCVPWFALAGRNCGSGQRYKVCFNAAWLALALHCSFRVSFFYSFIWFSKPCKALVCSSHWSFLQIRLAKLYL